MKTRVVYQVYKRVEPGIVMPITCEFRSLQQAVVCANRELDSYPECVYQVRKLETSIVVEIKRSDIDEQDEEDSTEENGQTGQTFKQH